MLVALVEGRLCVDVEGAGVSGRVKLFTELLDSSEVKLFTELLDGCEVKLFPELLDGCEVKLFAELLDGCEVLVDPPPDEWKAGSEKLLY